MQLVNEITPNKEKIKIIVNNVIEVIPLFCDIIVDSRSERLKQNNLITMEMIKSTNRKFEKIKDNNRLEGNP